PVRGSFEQLFALLDGGSYPQFNLAEIAWLQRYLEDSPTLMQKLAGYGPKLVFLGGGVSSPDNLVCDGEAVLRNYLVGRRWLRGRGLGAMISDVLWIPDDFGQDPNLPITVDAMGFAGAAFWRVPGQQSYQQPIEGPPRCSRPSARTASASGGRRTTGP